MIEPRRRGRLRSPRPHRRHRGARSSRPRRPARILAAAEDRSRHARRRRAPSRLDVGVRALGADPVRERRRQRGRRRRRRAVSLADYVNTQFDPALSWRDVEWMRSIWDGPIVIKGIQTVADALLAADAGVEADRAVEPWRPPTRRCAGPDRARRAGGRRGRRSHRDHLRRRCATRQRHRQGRRARRPGVHGGPGLPLRARRGRRTRCRPCAQDAQVGCAAHHGAPRGHLYPRAQPRVRVYALAHAASPARRVWRAIASTRPSGPHMVASSTAKPSRDRGERHET